MNREREAEEEKHAIMRQNDMARKMKAHARKEQEKKVKLLREAHKRNKELAARDKDRKAEMVEAEKAKLGEMLKTQEMAAARQKRLRLAKQQERLLSIKQHQEEERINEQRRMKNVQEFERHQILKRKRSIAKFQVVERRRQISTKKVKKELAEKARAREQHREIILEKVKVKDEAESDSLRQQIEEKHGAFLQREKLLRQIDKQKSVAIRKELQAKFNEQREKLKALEEMEDEWVAETRRQVENKMQKAQQFISQRQSLVEMRKRRKLEVEKRNKEFKRLMARLARSPAAFREIAKMNLNLDDPLELVNRQDELAQILDSVSQPKQHKHLEKLAAPKTDGAPAPGKRSVENTQVKLQYTFDASSNGLRKHMEPAFPVTATRNIPGGRLQM